MANETTVKLSCEKLEIKNQEFSITHAQRLLDLEKKMRVENWKLTDKNFTLNEDGTIERANKSADKGAKSQATAAKGG